MNEKHFGMRYTDSLAHHGILGQKWGVRRYQNPDGSLTPEGRDRLKYRNRISRRRQSTETVNRIVDKISKTEKRMLGVPKHERYMEDEQHNANVSRRFIQKVNGEPASFADVYRDGDIAIVTDPSYRGRNLADKSVKQIVSWYNKRGYKEMPQLTWWCENGNKSSIALAVNNGFKKQKTKWDDEYSLYTYKRRNRNE